MKIGLFTDPHYSNKMEPSENRMHTLSYQKIKEAMEFFQKENVDLVICLGDLTDDCVDINDNALALENIIGLIKSYDIKFYSLMGNHDYQSFTREEFDYISRGAYPPFMLETKNSILVFLDCNYQDDERPYVKRNVDWTNTYLPTEQLKKLENVIKSDKDIYVFSHQSIDNEVDINHIVRNSERIREIIRQGNTKMVIQGHYHKGHDTIIDGIKYHTLRAMCEGKENFYEILTIS